MILRTVQIFAILLLGSFAVAETKIISSVVSEKELADVLKVYRDISELKVPFSQVKRLKDISVPLEAQGQFQLIRPSTVVWEITSPAPVTVRLTDREIEIRSGSGKDAVIQKYKRDSMPKDESRSLAALATWMTLDSAKLIADYDITKLSAEQFLFKPKNSNELPFTSMKMTTAKNGHLSKLVIDEKSGDQMVISFGTSKVTLAKPVKTD